LSAWPILVVAVLAGAVCQLPAAPVPIATTGAELQASAHASVACATCHLGHDVYPTRKASRNPLAAGVTPPKWVSMPKACTDWR